ACVAPRGLSAIADPAVFGHGAILRRMLEGAARTRAGDDRPLASLGARPPYDPAVALIDAQAATAHVLAWTIRRLHLDGGLATTEDRAALASLVGLLGYAPRPALAASTLLAFAVEETPGAPERATVKAGLRVATVPAQGEMPVSFEVDLPIEARRAWNALSPLRALERQTIGVATSTISLEGPAPAIRAGDHVLLMQRPAVAATPYLLARVAGVARSDPPGPIRTTLRLAGGIALAAAQPSARPGPDDVVVLGLRAQGFGAVAPDLRFMPEEVRRAQIAATPATTTPPTEWRDFVLSRNGGANGGVVDLDALAPEAAAGSAVVFRAPGLGPALGRITAAAEAARNDFGLSARVTTITVEGVNLGGGGFNTLVRQTTILIETGVERLRAELADPLVPADGEPDRLILTGAAELPAGRRVALTGVDAQGAPLAEAAMVERSEPAADGWRVIFTDALKGRWRASSLRVLANCAPASQAETLAPETLGEGDPSRELQRFGLKQAPLAHVAAPGPRGYAPALTVRVGGRRFDAVETLHAIDPAARVHTVELARDGGASIRFAGRLPTAEVVAEYRRGGGAAGNLAAGRLTMIMTPTPGIASVVNPLPAEGGADPEPLEAMRSDAPKSIRTLGRAVSLKDYEAFALGFRGVGKALASDLRDGGRREICLTIATTTLAPPAAGGDLARDLSKALRDAAPPGARVRVAGFVDLQAVATLALETDPALERPIVEGAVRAKLAAIFGRAARPFATALHRSQVLAAAQTTPGVRSVHLMTLALSDGTQPDAAGRLPCPGPRLQGGLFTPAALLSLSADAVTLTEMTP
ncbi:MAG: baseplate J/gp47 family protein, partial [Rubrimonas sp.]